MNHPMSLVAETASWRCWYGIQRVFALNALIFATPLLAVLFVAVRLDSPGGFLFRQQRPGRGGRLFSAVKVRTMSLEAEGDPMLARAVTSASPEVTRIGRVLRDLKVDELPQLWNVVRGEMALVGPRPIAIPLQEHLEQKIPCFADRLSVRPGLTSLGQVCIDENAAVEEVVKDWSIRFEAERHYLANRSIAYDLVIIGLTIRYCWRKLSNQFSYPRPKNGALEFFTQRS
jgi:lipopolysaccharide/colanic/teichoic acid biosynthesis glycosyltransferase